MNDKNIAHLASFISEGEKDGSIRIGDAMLMSQSIGGMLAWAVAEVIVINKSEEWVRPEPGEAKKDIVLVVITIVVYIVVSLIHLWLGVSPFGV